MRMLKLPFLAMLLLVGMGLASPSQATLVARLDGQAVYDTDLNITWLANANVIGKVNWQTANDWVAGLNVGGFTGWRLPNADPACGIKGNCTNSEMGHLFYIEGHLHQDHPITKSTYLSSFFTNMSDWSWYSGQDRVVNNVTYAWGFDAGSGWQTDLSKAGGQYYAWAVRDGDVGGPAPAVPEPEEYMMIMLGFGMVAWQVTRKQRKSV